MYAFQAEMKNGSKENYAEVRGFNTLEQAEVFILAIRERLAAAKEAAQLTDFWLGDPYPMRTFSKVLLDAPKLAETVKDLLKSVG